MTLNELCQTVQERLGLTDSQMGAYIGCDVSTIRKARMGIEDLPVHSKLVLMNRAGFLVMSSTILALVPRKAKEKALAAINAKALTIAQEAELKALADELKKAKTTIDDDQEN